MNNNTKHALIIIDLQNDFLEDKHFSDQRGGDLKFNRSILPKIDQMCQVFRKRQSPIIWIHSVYGEVEEQKLSPLFFNPTEDLIKRVPLNNYLLSGSHNQSQPSCCKRDTTGIQFYKDVTLMQDKEKDMIIQKQYYSAFRKTALLDYLKEKSIQEVVVCGIATNYCCRATSVDAFHLGFNVAMLSDCLAASTQERHNTALKELKNTDLQVIDSSQFLLNLDEKTK
ncbi:hypothetical protein ABPG72_015123 [Tetrahymena utriculariae]